MGKVGFYLLSAIVLQGCVAVSTLGSIPSSVVEGTIYMFSGVKVSLPLPMKATLVTVQRGLRKISLDVNVLEQTEEGYNIEMGNEELDGYIALERETKSLTTLYIKVRKGALRQSSIEDAIINSIREQSTHLPRHAKFNLSAYLPLRKRPKPSSPVVGWYRQGALAALKTSKKKAWLLITMPSGKRAYLRAVPGKRKKNRHKKKR